VLVGLVGLVGAPLAALVLTATPAGAVGPGCQAGNIEVTTNTDAALRAAFTTANTAASGPSTICIDSGLGTITLLGGTELAYTQATTPGLTVLGNGITISGNNASRVIDNNTPGPLTLNGVTITGGNAPVAGGGVFSLGVVTLTNSTISGNTAATGGGGVAAGTVTLTNSTISGNTASAGGGGGIDANGAVTVTNSTVSGNHSSGDGGGIDLGGTSQTITLTDSTVSGNTAGGDGGGTNSGAGSGAAPSRAVLIRSTVSGNTATGDGGGVDANSVTATNSTITGNTAAQSGGIRAADTTLVYTTVVQNTAPSGANVDSTTLTSFGSVVALPLGGGANCTGTTTSKGFNFSDDASCGFTAATDKQNAGDPKLGALANNGGPTQTRLPQSGSPLIDAIPLASCQADGASGITTDQRSLARPSGPGCDIGAVEVQAAAPVVITPKFTG